MRDNNLSRLPKLLIALRAKKGLSQKAAALGAGLSQSVYCSIEKGRRGNLQPMTIELIARALDLDEDAHTRIVWAVEHDRVIDQVMNGPVSVAAPLVSAALEASTRLLPTEAQGLQKYMEDLLAAREKLERVATTGAGITTKKEVSAMS